MQDVGRVSSLSPGSLLPRRPTCRPWTLFQKHQRGDWFGVCCPIPTAAKHEEETPDCYQYIYQYINHYTLCSTSHSFEPHFPDFRRPAAPSMAFQERHGLSPESSKENGQRQEAMKIGSLSKNAKRRDMPKENGYPSYIYSKRTL